MHAGVKVALAHRRLVGGPGPTQVKALTLVALATNSDRRPLPPGVSQIRNRIFADEQEQKFFLLGRDRGQEEREKPGGKGRRSSKRGGLTFG